MTQHQLYVKDQYSSGNYSEENTACNSGHSSCSEEKPIEKKKSFDFPEGGWECSKCQNYNFKGRKECFRCKKSKDQEDYEGKPEHMFKCESNPKSHSKKGKKNTRPKNFKKKAYAQDINDENSNFIANKQQTSERAGDWAC